MVTEISEPVDVVAVFNRGRLEPAIFLWKKRRYRIRRVTNTWRDMEGQYRRHFFSVLVDSNNDLYELCFRTRDLSWQLVKVYSDG